MAACKQRAIVFGKKHFFFPKKNVFVAGRKHKQSSLRLCNSCYWPENSSGCDKRGEVCVEAAVDRLLKLHRRMKANFIIRDVEWHFFCQHHFKVCFKNAPHRQESWGVYCYYSPPISSFLSPFILPLSAGRPGTTCCPTSYPQMPAGRWNNNSHIKTTDTFDYVAWQSVTSSTSGLGHNSVLLSFDHQRSVQKKINFTFKQLPSWQTINLKKAWAVTVCRSSLIHSLFIVFLQITWKEKRQNRRRNL